ncbi:Uncharacterised protein [Serratia quinivorans]|nr:Uncharacterised protein [Serratia quinivorans]CAI1780620.1 Uncharacterised protein [Serratia proteamaculans]CAI0987644.1 Uncharacterised protein [Serratia quinivorans]CAI1777907.1 Uncharacterised protein [Serratia quinivorans]CAI2105832.1 Uncharacterised protein [Serratia quinivorans]
MDKYSLQLTLLITFAFMMVMNSGCKPFIIQDVMP